MRAGYRTGLLLGAGANVVWGLLPIYLRMLHGVPALQVLSHRVLWSVLLLVVLVSARGRGRAVMAAARGRTLLLLCISAALISLNWQVYIWAAMGGHVLEASLGYFLNPLVNVGLGVAILHERISRGQVVAIGLAALGVATMALGRGGSLWIPITLALTFSIYGLIRKLAATGALGGLTVETFLLAPFALAVVVHAGVLGHGAFGHERTLDLLLVAAGVITAIPLLMFASAARRLPYSIVGLLQFISPTLQFLEATLLFGEPLRAAEVAAFVLIWSGCALYAVNVRSLDVVPLAAADPRVTEMSVVDARDMPGVASEMPLG